jgi:uncharacterized protein (DUF2249 family)
MNNHTVTLDVREDLRNGREPFTKIMSTVVALRPGEQFRLIVPFEPTPLFEVMERRGFRHAAQSVESGDWEVLFTRDQTLSGSPSSGDEAPVSVESASQSVELDARGLEPPQPLIKILEAVAALPAGSQLRARTDRRPMHLYSQLEDRGFKGETEEQSDGSYLTHICHL